MHRALFLSLAPALLVGSPALALQATGKDTVGPPPPLYDTPTSLGGAFSDSIDPPLITLGLGGLDTVLYQLNLPNRRWKEQFLVVRPAAGAPLPYPVLTLFHGFGETPQAVVNNTPLAAEAAARGWLVVIPTGAHPFNYGIDYAQDNIEDVFEALPALGYVIDLERVYAVGFSMGGGAAASFAARHMDPTRVRFAAVVNHTGSTSLRDTYAAAGLPSLFESPLMFGGSPIAAAFRYQRSSAIDLKPGNLIDPDTDMVRNLRHIPVIHWSATNDPLQYLVDQSRAMHLQLLNVWGGNSQWNMVQASTHNWMTLATTILDTLGAIQLVAVNESAPVPVLADRSGRWHQFSVLQRREREFSPFIAAWSGATNHIDLTQMENVAAIGFDLTANEMRLDPSAPFTVTIATRTQQAVDVRIGGLAGSPTSVRRGSVLTSAWTYDNTTGFITLLEPEGYTGPTWTVNP